MSQPLQGKRILVTRPVAQAANLAERIGAAGGKAVCFPLLVITPMENLLSLEAAIASFEEFNLAVFISPNAVAFSIPFILSRRAWPENVRAAAVGSETAVRLASFGIRDVLFPDPPFDSEALLALPALQSDVVTGMRILILRGDGGRDFLADTLRSRGAQVECVACYHRRASTDRRTIVSLLCNNELDAVTISSSEGLRNLLDLLGAASRQRLLSLPVFVPHPRIAVEAKRLGLCRVVQTEPDDAGLVTGMCHFDWFDHE